RTAVGMPFPHALSAGAAVGPALDPRGADAARARAGPPRRMPPGRARTAGAAARRRSALAVGPFTAGARRGRVALPHVLCGRLAMKSRRLGCALVVAVLALGVLGPAGAVRDAGSKYGGTLVVGLTGGEPDSLDPTVSRGSAISIYPAFCQRLFAIARNHG